jgi:hypothetical protein
MWFPIVGYQFDVHSCDDCEFFRLVPTERSESRAPSEARHYAPLAVL